MIYERSLVIFNDEVRTCWSSVGADGLLSLLVASCPSNMLVYLRDGSAQTVVCAATLR